MALLGSAVVFAMAAPQAGFAQSSPLIGTWKLNPAKSTYSPGAPLRSQTVTFQSEGQGLRMTVDTIDAQGKLTKTVGMILDDGKFHPVKGVSAYDASSFKIVNDSTTWCIRTKAGKVVQTLIIEVSADNKTLTVAIAGVTANGRYINNVNVSDKQ
jgi:hypothetical protein